jgi:8-oxo-dGTP pyrophosphatase MutT (NUDIX family)
VLLIKRRDNGQRQIPGGVLELGESIHAGLIREVHEETGLLVEPGVKTCHELWCQATVPPLTRT